MNKMSNVSKEYVEKLKKEESDDKDFNKIIGVITMNKINDNRFNATDENNLAI
jgi:hypothetical protein